MALYEKVQKSDDDDDDDLEALRLAALQTMGTKPAAITTTVVPNTFPTHQKPMRQHSGPGRGFRGGMGRNRPGRNQVFQRHRMNSNLIAIVPVNTDSTSAVESSESTKTARTRGLAGSDSAVKLTLPQDRYCKKAEDKQEEKTDTPLVSSKFSRYDNSDSDSSAEESDEDNSSEKKTGSDDEEDADVLTVVEESFENLVYELEKEINKSDVVEPENDSAKKNAEPQKKTKKSNRNTCDSSKSQEQTVPVSNPLSKKRKNSSKNPSNDKKDFSDSVPVSSNSTNYHKDSVLLENEKTTKPTVMVQKSYSSPRRQLSPIHRPRPPSPRSNAAHAVKGKNSRSPTPLMKSRKSRSRSPVTKSRRSRSRTPVTKGRKSRSHSPLMKGRKSRSRSPVTKGRKSRSRSPVTKGRKSRSHSPLMKGRKSRSRSPVTKGRKSRSRSPVTKGRKSRSHSPVTKSRKSRSRTPVMKSRRSRSRTPVMKGRRSRSRTPLTKGRISRSRSPVTKGRKSRSRSPVLKGRKSRSRSPVLKGRKSPSPRSRYYSPLRNQKARSPRTRLSRSPISRGRLSRSPVPRGRLSRSPIRAPRTRSRSRSPLRSLRSSPRRHSRSPPAWHTSRLSPLPRLSPRSRRPLSPRRSPSPRISRHSPRRTPESRWWTSPRRSITPLVRRSLSPLPRARKVSVSPRRQISPARRRLSPSPVRRLSPPRWRSVSRSPDRSLPRARSPLVRSPIGKGMHHGSFSPKRRISRSPSPRRISHSPINRLPPRHSPVGRKSSPWSPGARRYSNSPGRKPRSISPYSHQRRRSGSPARRPPLRTQRSRSPVRRPQDTRSRSPLPPRQQHDANVRHSHSPRPVHSPPRRSRNRSRSSTSSISLSPSPDRSAVNNTHRYKSPLRVHTADYRNTSKERINNRQPQGTRDEKVSSPKSRPGKRKEDRTVDQKQRRSKEDSRRDLDRRSKESREKSPVCDPLPVGNTTTQSENVNLDPKLAILEARRRKFESTGPVKPLSKKIRLKTSEPALPPSEPIEKQEEFVEATEETVLTEKSTSTMDDSELLGTGDDDLDEPFIELQAGDLWSSDESGDDNEGRFKSSDSRNAKVTMVPFAKLLGEPKAPVRTERTTSKHKKSSSSLKKHGSADRKKEESKSKKDSSKGASEVKTQTGTAQEEKKAVKVEPEKEKVAVESKISNPNAEEEMLPDLSEKSKDGDLRAELSRRRAERLTKAGSLHESLPRRLLQNAFEGVVGKKGAKLVDKDGKESSGKRPEIKKDKCDGRRVLVLKRRQMTSVVEPRIPSISVTIPKENKHELDEDSPPSKLPIRMRLGLPADALRRRNRKVKLKRNVTLSSRPDDKV